MSSLTLITAPMAEPVTLEQALNHLRVDEIDEEIMITALIKAAREQAEQILRRAIITQTWEIRVNCWPGVGCITLPYPTLQQVDSIKYLDGADVEQTLSAAVYQVTTAEPAQVCLREGQVWPVLSWQKEAVRIQYTCGYGDSADSVPESIKRSILLLVESLYDREDSKGIGETAKMLLMPFRAWALPV